MRAAIDGVDAGRLVRRALADPPVLDTIRRARAVNVIAAGKAAAAMLAAFDAVAPAPVRQRVGIGPGLAPALDVPLEWFAAGHPLPTPASVEAARRALEVARKTEAGELLLVLLSGGGSALMALPAPGISLDDKQRTSRVLMDHGADIHELNTVRKHLSAIKGGQLAAAAGGPVLTLAVSDVVGDDLSVIASGPTVADESTFAAALDVIARRGGEAAYPRSVTARLQEGARGLLPETPKAGDPRLADSRALVIGPQRGAVEGARRAAEDLGYEVYVIAEPITGEARVVGAAHVERAAALAEGRRGAACIISSGETTVTVTGGGRGGRNQEFAFAMAGALARLGLLAAAASVGTDGIDGPTDAAGAVVDPDTFVRARRAGIAAPDDYLRDNDTYAFFDRIGDLVRTGPTSTNVGDLQVVLLGP